MTKVLQSLIAGMALTAISTTAFAGDLIVDGVAKMDKKGEIGISGSGFPAGTEVKLIFATADGVESDITYALDPAPVADTSGEFSTTWAYGRFVNKKLVAPGDFPLMATDADFNPLGETKITFAE